MGLKLQTTFFALFLGVAMNATAEKDLTQARQALTKQDNDADTEKALEEVFEAAENNYSLLKRGGMALNYAFDYSYYGDQRINLVIEPVLDSDGNTTSRSNIINADVQPAATHSFTNSFTFDYGLLNNLTLSGRLPLVAKFDTEESITNFNMGDMSGTMRWQPFAYIPGTLTKTFFGTLKLKTGTSPYDVDLNKNLPTGSGTYSLTGGISVSKVLDPVVLFGSGTYSYTLAETSLNQVRDGAVLEEVHPGAGLSFSMGFAYSLSYDVSFSASFQGSYSDETKFVLRRGSQKITNTVGSQMTGIMNFALGVRVSPKTITNISVGFGVTELAPDILLGVSLPIDIEGAKVGS